MKLARVTGTVEATAKDMAFTGAKLLLLDLIDGAGDVAVPAFVAVDTCGAGVGDQVLVTFNSAARMAGSLASVPTDAAIVAVVDRVTLGGAPAPKSSSSKRRKS